MPVAWMALVALVLLGTLAPAASAGAQRARLVAVTAPPPEHRADPGLKTYVYRFGPHRIGPYQVASGTDAVSPPPVRGAIVAMDTRLVTRAGAAIPQSRVMLHHIVYTDGGPDGRRRDLACPGRPIQRRFFGTSEELRPLTLPRGYGYRTAPRDRWRASWMLMNHRARGRSALLEYRVTVDPDPAIVPVQPLWLSVLPCGRGRDPQWSVPGGGAPGSTDYRARTWRLPFGGRIVAVGAHLHGGARRLTVGRPRCGATPFVSAQPVYAPAGDPLYALTPLLHEPDPKSISWAQSATGWSVPAGSRLQVTAAYDAERPHMRVMGIAHVYIARGPAPAGCAAPPDAETLGAPFAGRPEPPAIGLTLAGIGRDGLARPIERPPGPVVRRSGDTTVRVAHYAFSRPNLSIPRGSRITWRFSGATRHDATLAAGPVGFASPSANAGRTWSRRFRTPGEYRIYCSLHPVYMSQYVRVR
jgi:plastocyanin